MQGVHNCIICGGEFTETGNEGEAFAKINIGNFKVCASCLELDDPEEDFAQVKLIVSSYLEQVLLSK